jgi:dTMP kinase
MSQRGVLVAFEGIDGGGKTTQAARLAEWGKGQGLEVVSTKEPTSGPFGQRIRASKFTARLSVDEELECFIEDRKQHVAELVAPALERGALVIIDRYYYSTAAYQGARGKNPREILARNEAFAPVPDVVVLMDLPVQLGLSRVQTRGEGQDVFENTEALTRAREVFLSLPGPVLRLDASRTKDELTVDITVHVAALIAQRS